VLELLPAQQLAFQRMLDTIRRGFERFGYLPIETPTFELSEVLLTKSGGDTEKQVYFVQSTGALERKTDKRPELALRFDLTVPLARYVAEHEHELSFPFRRYQIQLVYRGERPQKGRFREFYQCDIDVVGKDALAIEYDAEVPAVIHRIFTDLAFGNFTIKINNRKMLRGLLESFAVPEDQQAAVLREIDRLGKQERADVQQRLSSLLDDGSTERLLDVLLAHRGDSQAALQSLRTRNASNELFQEGLDELQRVYERTLALGVPESGLSIDLSIVRGLDYYTGTVYETFLDEHPRIGSICSGGRYDSLAGHFTKSKLPGVGISIGATRLFSQLLDLGVIAASTRTTAQVLVLAVEPELTLEYARIGAELRAAGLNVEVYASGDKLGKQLKYADRSGVPVAVLLGSRERSAGLVRIKDLRVSSEIDVPRDQLAARLRALLG
jgi:histidyl-tRNA synthetase